MNVSPILRNIPTLSPPTLSYIITHIPQDIFYYEILELYGILDALVLSKSTFKKHILEVILRLRQHQIAFLFRIRRGFDMHEQVISEAGKELVFVESFLFKYLRDFDEKAADEVFLGVCMHIKSPAVICWLASSYMPMSLFCLEEIPFDFRLLGKKIFNCIKHDDLRFFENVIRHPKARDCIEELSFLYNMALRYNKKDAFETLHSCGVTVRLDMDFGIWSNVEDATFKAFCKYVPIEHCAHIALRTTRLKWIKYVVKDKRLKTIQPLIEDAGMRDRDDVMKLLVKAKCKKVCSRKVYNRMMPSIQNLLLQHKVNII